VAEGEHDGDTVDVLTGIVIELEKQGWFLRASLDG
jgi:DNA-binding ferritin-like protein